MGFEYFNQILWQIPQRILERSAHGAHRLIAGHATPAHIAADGGGLLEGLDVDQQIVGTAGFVSGATDAIGGHVQWQNHGIPIAQTICAHGFPCPIQGTSCGSIGAAIY